MKSVFLLSSLILSSITFAQHNYVLTSPEADATFIRDAEVLNETNLICALDLRTDRDGDIDIINTGMAVMNDNGEAIWAKKIHIENSEKTLGLDVVQHPNGDYYFHGITIVDYKQYGFVLRVRRDGKLIKSKAFELGSDICYAINKMKLSEEGELVVSMYSGHKVFFIGLSPEMSINWETGFSTSTEGSGKQPGFDFQFVDDGIVAIGKSGRHFSLMKVSKKGNVDYCYEYKTGDYSLAKTIQVLPDGNMIITGDYLIGVQYKSFIAKIDGLNGTALWMKKIKQFDGTFHYQQTELLDNEIHWSLMGNNDPSMMDPDFQNYYLTLDFDGNVYESYRNGERYELADYQRLLRTENSSIIYGSAYTNTKEIGGLVHSYQSHEFDPCYWTAMELSTSATSHYISKDLIAPQRRELKESGEITIKLKNLGLISEGTCKQVWNESMALEEENSITPETIGETSETVVENNEYARENHESLLNPEYEFTVFPNPNRGVFNIKTDYLMVDVIVIDQTGKVVYTGVAENGDAIDLSDRPTGVYIMKIITETDNFIRRIVVE